MIYFDKSLSTFVRILLIGLHVLLFYAYMKKCFETLNNLSVSLSHWWTENEKIIIIIWLKKPKNVSWDHHLQRKRDRSLVYNNGCILTMQVNGIARYVHVPSSQRQGFVIQELRNYKALTLWR